MNKPCPNMQDMIADYVLGILGSGQQETVTDHIASCQACAAYCDAINREHEALERLGQDVQDGLPARRDKVIDALRSYTPAQPHPLWIRILTSGAARLAVAAVVLITAGFLAGRLSAPTVDAELLRAQLYASLAEAVTAQVEQDMLAQLSKQYDTAFAANSDRLKDQLHQQVRRDLTEFAAQTLAASRTMTDQRIIELVRSIEAARAVDRRRIATALSQIEWNRYRDKTEIGSGLETIAARTTELLHTQPN